MSRRFRSLILSVVSLLLAIGSARAAEPKPGDALPKVLILGDSISIGYTPLVKKNLADRAEVSRPNGNCQHTAYGLSQIDTWLGETKWDVIHFNWGIWDTHMLTADGKLVRDEKSVTVPLHIRHTPEQYRENLTALVKRLKATGAKLVWAETTPILRYEGDRLQAVPRQNAIAAEIMQANGVAVDALYEPAMAHAKEWQTADRVHFNAVGNEQLARRASDAILQALDAKAAK
jgi:lysophospholipase L1-like esterase